MVPKHQLASEGAGFALAHLRRSDQIRRRIDASPVLTRGDDVSNIPLSVTQAMGNETPFLLARAVGHTTYVTERVIRITPGSMSSSSPLGRCPPGHWHRR